MNEECVLNAPEQQQEQEEIIGQLVVKRDAALTVRLSNGRLQMLDYLQRAKAINPRTEEDIAECSRLVSEIRGEGETLLEIIAPFKAQVRERLDMILSIEKLFTASVPKAQQATARADERCIAFQATDMIKKKMNAAYDEIERRKEEEARKVEELARKEADDRIKKIGAAMDKLLEKAESLAEQKAVLEARLEDQSITLEEAEVIRARIEKIEVQLGNAQAKASEKQVEVAQLAQPISVPVEQTKIGGVSTKVVWIPTVTNPRSLLQAVMFGSVPMSAIKWDITAIKQYGNAMVKGTKNQPSVPGVSWQAERTTSIKG